MGRRRLALLALVAELAAGAIGTTVAEGASVVVVPHAPAPGTLAVLSGAGFAAQRRAVVELGKRRWASVRVDPRGRFRQALRVPARWLPGRHRLVVRAGRRRVAAFVALRRRPSPPSALAAVSGGVRFVVGALRGRPGARIRIDGWGLRPRTRIVTWLGGRRAGAGRAGRGGRLRLAVSVPGLGPGNHALTLRGRRVRARIGFTVAPAPARPAPTPAATPPIVVAAGDIACSPHDASFNRGGNAATACRQMATAHAAASVGPTAVLPLGDTQYESGAFEDYMRSYRPSWGRFDRIAFPVVGDEEYGTAGAAGYFAYFGPRAGEPGRGYYSYELGGWHLIALNSNCDRVSCAPRSAQERWLRADLAAHRARCTLAYWHAPRFESGTPAPAYETEPFWEALYAADADVVLGGNAHIYERFAPQRPDGTRDPHRGIREFVVGTGGESLQRFGRVVRRNSDLRRNDTFGILALTLRPRAYDWRFVPAAGGRFRDAGSASCHGRSSRSRRPLGERGSRSPSRRPPRMRARVR